MREAGISAGRSEFRIGFLSFARYICAMSTLDPATAAAADFYDAHYAASQPIVLQPGNKHFLGKPDRPFSCRFCGKAEPEVSFKDEAHAIPAAFGNTGLFSRYECDACNHLFGEGIENQLGNWSKPMRTLGRIRGRSGVPSIKQPGSEPGWRVDYADGGFKLKEYEDDPKFTIDQENKQLRFDLHRDTYTPVAVLKGLVKIGLTLLPEAELVNFKSAFAWIKEADHSKPFVTEFPIYRTFIPGPVRNDLIFLMLLRRRSGIDTVPYACLIFSYGHEVLQVFLPSPEQDACIHGKELQFPAFPNPGTADASRYGKPSVTPEDLTGRQPIRGQTIPFTLHFDAISEEASA